MLTVGWELSWAINQNISTIPGSLVCSQMAVEFQEGDLKSNVPGDSGTSHKTYCDLALKSQNTTVFYCPKRNSAAFYWPNNSLSPVKVQEKGNKIQFLR